VTGVEHGHADRVLPVEGEVLGRDHGPGTTISRVTAGLVAQPSGVGGATFGNDSLSGDRVHAVWFEIEQLADA
jgi:hypothetical protein